MTRLRSPRPLSLSISRACGAAALGIVVSLGVAVTARAERADRQKPMNIEADRGRYDDQKGVGTFTGNVVVSKGTILIRAGQIEVRQTAEGHQTGVATATPGRLASFRQKREGVDETIEGEAERIEYDSRADTVRLVNRAVIRRYRGATLADETTGSLITYDNAAEVFSVNGSPAGSDPASPAGSGRVRATLTPRDAPAAENGASAPPLRPSPGLGGTQ